MIPFYDYAAKMYMAGFIILMIFFFQLVCSPDLVLCVCCMRLVLLCHYSGPPKKACTDCTFRHLSLMFTPSENEK